MQPAERVNSQNIATTAEEIPLHIFGKLKFWEVVNVTRVCSTFRRVGTDEQLWQKLLSYYFGNQEKKGTWLNTFRRQFLNYFEKVEKNLENVKDSFPANSAVSSTLSPAIIPPGERKAVYIWQEDENGYTGKWHSLRKIEAYCKDKGATFQTTPFYPHFIHMSSYHSNDPSQALETWNTSSQISSNRDLGQQYNEFFKELK